MTNKETTLKYLKNKFCDNCKYRGKITFDHKDVVYICLHSEQTAVFVEDRICYPELLGANFKTNNIRFRRH